MQLGLHAVYLSLLPPVLSVVYFNITFKKQIAQVLSLNESSTPLYDTVI